MNRSAFSRPLSVAVLVACVGLGAFTLGGCGRDQEPEVITVNEGAGGGAGSAAVAEDGQCARWLENATGMLAPGKLGRTSDADRAAQFLTLYLQQEACTGVPPGPLPLAAAESETAAAEALLVRLLGEEGVDAVTNRRADAADARFLRTRLMDAAAVSAAIGRDAAPEAVALALNRHVADRLFPLGASLVNGERPAGSTYHARLRGEGDWADRAWLFADLLRQAGLDSLLLTPWGTGDPDEPTAWVGVLLPGDGAAEIALFDLRTGLPVPSPNAPDRPVRLSELRENDAARTALRDFYQAAELPAPPFLEDDGAAIGDLAPQLIGENEWWRMASGLIVLPTVEGPGGRTPRTFDPLHDRVGQPGLVSRAASAGFEREAITLWPVPAERAAAATDAPIPPTFNAPMRVGLQAPGAVTITEEGDFEYDRERATPITAPGDELWTARHAQLAGGSNGAREAGGLLEGLLSAEQIGSLFSPRPLPPVSDRDVQGELAKDRRSADAAGEAIGLSRDEREVNAILRAAAANGVAPWPLDRPLPPEVQAVHGAAIPEAALFLAETQLDRGRKQAASELLGNLVFGPANPRKATAAGRLAELVATGGDPATAAGLARQYVGGPDGPRLKVWIARWTAPPPAPPDASAAEGAQAEGTSEVEGDVGDQPEEE
ncbi:hypothetical protein [Alienimonas californiensis]|uniref:Uncharacterized protein n=1 Tax=Alienimonas californiensis TaxID=2527989 RepID=A0A517P7V5_9PLAN|nr:hypothetical protein [Alienimonas californiensis]QDT15443.1 hypothetical protein CA12_15280 [Alienimonas californiensis]